MLLILNEFEMMWALRERFPLHFIVFTQVASHLSHEANVEQVFSRAGSLANVHMDPDFLATLVMACANKKAYAPPVAAIKDKYYALFTGKQGGAGTSSGERGVPREDDEAEQEAMAAMDVDSGDESGDESGDDSA